MRLLKPIRFALIVVVLSVLLNVAIAWTAALLVDTSARPAREVSFKRGYTEHSPSVNNSLLLTWVVVTRHGFASVEVHSEARGIQGVEESYFDGSDAHPRTGLPGWVDPYIKVLDSKQVYCVGRGWPWVALVTDHRREFPPSTGVGAMPSYDQLADVMTGWVLESMPWASGRPRVLPTRIVWKGFIGNSVLFAAVILLPSIVRWVTRRVRGRCPSCGYDVRGEYASGCPECGWRRA